jgi:6-phosphogluconolactonase
LRLTVGADAWSAARLAADELARACLAAVASRGRALIAVSGGQTPWRMIADLAARDLPWGSIHVAQVDERCVPRGDARRNLTQLEELLVRRGPLAASNLLALPADAVQPEAAAADFERRLADEFGRPLRFDLVQLGLGMDGHTASLVPGGSVLSIADRDVAVTEPYEGLRRMTLTLGALDRARERLWLVTGSAKAQRLAQLLAGRGDIPAVRVSRHATTVVADAAAANACAGAR